MSGIQVPDMFCFEKCQIWQEHIMDHEPFFLPRSGLKLDIMVNVDTEIEIDFKIGAKQASNQIAAPAKSIFDQTRPNRTHLACPDPPWDPSKANFSQLRPT